MLRWLSAVALASFGAGILSGGASYDYDPERNLLYRAVVKLIVKYEELSRRVENLEERVEKLEKVSPSREEIDLREFGVVRVWLRLRSEPSLKAPVYFVMRPNEKVEILERYGEWYKVRTMDGYVGYAYAKYIVPFER